MASRRILLLYISEHSGHHCASKAIQRAIASCDPSAETLSVNSFNYTNPILEKVINKTYMGVIKRTPEVWEYLYDNPKVLKKTQRLREMLHRFNTGKLRSLIDDFRPHAVVCTQAFPCGMVADYKRTFDLDMPLMGVLTDYAPHSYWIFNNVDRYVVPSEAAGQQLIDNGVDRHKILVYGIPVDPKFAMRHDRDKRCAELGLSPRVPCVLLMGGTQGLGPLRELLRLLDRSGHAMQLIVTCGTNHTLLSWCRTRRFTKKVLVLPYANNIDELMEISSVVVTKPGGITTAEALAKALPMLIIHPLPGQESMNTRFLLDEGVAIRAQKPADAVVLLEELLYNTDKLAAMREKARALARPDSAMRIAEYTLELANA